MAHKEPPRVAYIAALLARHAPHAGVHPYACARIAADLVRVANQLRRCYEADCNGWPHNQDAWNEVGQPRNQRRIARLLMRAETLFAESGVPGILRHNADPRGPALRIETADGREHPIY